MRLASFTTLDLVDMNQLRILVEALGVMIKAHALLQSCNDLLTVNQVAQQSHPLHSKPIAPATKKDLAGIADVHPRMLAEEVVDLAAVCPLVVWILPADMPIVVEALW